MERTLSNGNLIQESMIGQMVRVHTGNEHPGFRRNTDSASMP
jgi:ribosomal protein S19